MKYEVIFNIHLKVVVEPLYVIGLFTQGELAHLLLKISFIL